VPLNLEKHERFEHKICEEATTEIQRNTLQFKATITIQQNQANPTISEVMNLLH